MVYRELQSFGEKESSDVAKIESILSQGWTKATKQTERCCYCVNTVLLFSKCIEVQRLQNKLQENN